MDYMPELAILPKVERIGYSFLVLLGCPSRRYDLGTTQCEATRVKSTSGDRGDKAIICNHAEQRSLLCAAMPK